MLDFCWTSWDASPNEIIKKIYRKQRPIWPNTHFTETARRSKIEAFSDLFRVLWEKFIHFNTCVMFRKLNAVKCYTDSVSAEHTTSTEGVFYQTEIWFAKRKTLWRHSEQAKRPENRGSKTTALHKKYIIFFDRCYG